MSNAPFVVSGCLPRPPLRSPARAEQQTWRAPAPLRTRRPLRQPIRPAVAIDAAGSYRSQAAKIGVGKNCAWITLLRDLSPNGTLARRKSRDAKAESLK